MLNQIGLDKKVVDATPSMCYGVECRAREVFKWTQMHPEFKGNWIAIDDQPLYEQPGGELL